VSEPKSLRHSLAALSRWAGTDPDERARHMAELSRLSAEKRAADRAEREARGEVVAKPKRRARSVEPLPPVSDLLPVMGDIQRERADAGLSELAVEPLMREASLRIRRSVAEDTYNALKGDGS
jgi:hypothetical protein